MASYVELIQNDILYHESRKDAAPWPSFVSQFVQSLQNELKLPRWLESGSVPYTTERVHDLLNQLHTSDNATHNDLWEDTDKIVDDRSEERLRATFNTALVDCARIQAVLAAEKTTGTAYPKQSFLAILVRNAMFNADTDLCSLDDVPVVLPRHFSGESIPILKYMTKKFVAPLIVSICQEMPVEEDCDPECLSSDEDENERASSIHSLTMSEFLAERTIIHEEEEEEEEEPRPPQFEAYFLAPSSSIAPPSACHIPVLCMGDEDQLPIMMSSFLYQRRVWDIRHPLVGVEISGYDTAIKLYVGWLEDDMPSDRVLPRVHLGVIEMPVTLDLSSPPIALVVSRVLCGLESHIAHIRDAVSRSVGAVVSKTQSYSSFSWRIDTDVPRQDLDSNLSQDAINRWTERQQLFECDSARTMAPKKKADEINLLGSKTSKALSQKSTGAKTSNAESSTIPSKGRSLHVPKIEEPDGKTESGGTRFSCSEFAATSEKEEYRVYRWMFDRKVVPQCIPSDSKFSEKYEDMTCFIWPDTWEVRNDLPKVDKALDPYVHELVDSVNVLRARSSKAVKLFSPEEFPVDLRILEQYFSTIFQASHRSRGYKQVTENVYEASWRFDHDHLLFDFFIRLVQGKEGDTARVLKDQSIARLEDPHVRATLEATLRLPRSDLLADRDSQERHRRLLDDLISHRPNNLYDWMSTRGAQSQYVEERENQAYAISQWGIWARATEAEEASMTASIVHGLPSTGRCDALGRLLVELQDVSSNDRMLQLVARSASTTKTSPSGRTKKSRSIVKKSTTAIYFSDTNEEPRTERAGDSLIVPDASAAGATATTKGTRYNIPSSSISSCFAPVIDTTTDPTIVMLSKVQKSKTSTNNAQLELPILAVEYKKQSDAAAKGTNQLRMYLTASVKFLQAIGIVNVPVYGAQTNGPITAIPVAILKDDGFVYLFERLVEKLDISTALGAWHYATILCRLAQNHAKDLKREFEQVAVRGHGKSQDKKWTMEDQKNELMAENNP